MADKVRGQGDEADYGASCLASTLTLAWAHEAQPEDTAGGQDEVIMTAVKRSESLKGVLLSVIPGLAGVPNTFAVTTLGDDIFSIHVKGIDRDFAMFGKAAFNMFNIAPTLTSTAGVRDFVTRKVGQRCNG